MNGGFFFVCDNMQTWTRCGERLDVAVLFHFCAYALRTLNIFFCRNADAGAKHKPTAMSVVTTNCVLFREHPHTSAVHLPPVDTLWRRLQTEFDLAELLSDPSAVAASVPRLSPEIDMAHVFAKLRMLYVDNVQLAFEVFNFFQRSHPELANCTKYEFIKGVSAAVQFDLDGFARNLAAAKEADRLGVAAGEYERISWRTLSAVSSHCTSYVSFIGRPSDEV